MKIVSVILARGGSKGIPNKNLRLLCNKSLLAWTVSHCIKAKRIDDVWVSSDSDQILEEAEKIYTFVEQKS